MTFEDIISKVSPHSQTRPHLARILYDFVLSTDIRAILELGSAQGATACVMAAALQEKGGGSVMTMDRQQVLSLRPNILTLMEQTGLQSYVNSVLANRSYNWELMKLIERQTVNGVCTPLFDFCFIDGAHSWDIDGMAFFLAEKLLHPGGWLLFDDMHWTAARDFSHEPEWVQSLPEDERDVAQVERVFTLLVQQHPRMRNISIHDRWGWAQKAPASDAEDGSSDGRKIEALYSRQGIIVDVISALNKLRRWRVHRDVACRNR